MGVVAVSMISYHLLHSLVLTCAGVKFGKLFSVWQICQKFGVAQFVMGFRVSSPKVEFSGVSCPVIIDGFLCLPVHKGLGGREQFQCAFLK